MKYSYAINKYIESPVADYLQTLCLSEGVLHHYERDEAFFSGWAFRLESVNFLISDEPER